MARECRIKDATIAYCFYSLNVEFIQNVQDEDNALSWLDEQGESCSEQLY